MAVRKKKKKTVKKTKHKIVTLRLDWEDYAHLKEMATRRRLPLASMMKQMLFGEAA